MNRRILGTCFVCILSVVTSNAQSKTDMAALRGLLPASTLMNTDQGRAVVGANLAITRGINTGVITQSGLMSFSDRQQQALRDTFMMSGNFSGLADGLGSTLGRFYQARAHYLDRSQFESFDPQLRDLISYANVTTSLNANSAKYFFGNQTTNGRTAVSVAAKKLLADAEGISDFYGVAYGLVIGSPGSDMFGNSRPFQTEPDTIRIIGRDFFSDWTDNRIYNRGPLMNLVDSPSFPSGHTVLGYTGAIILAVLVPARYQQMITRGAEYGNGRILMGAHYAMDVVAGRTLALYDMAHLLSNDPDYVGQRLKPEVPVIEDFRGSMKREQETIKRTFESDCKKNVDTCAREDTGRFRDDADNAAFYAATLTYSLPILFPKNVDKREDVKRLAPRAASLLTVAFPDISDDDACRILTETEGPGGGFLDDGSEFGVFSRLDLVAAARRVTEIREARKAQP